MKIIGMGKTLAAGGIIFALSYLPLYWLAVNAPEFSEETIYCGKLGVALLIDNPIERFITRATITTRKEGDVVFVSGYTFFGIPISKFETNCATGSSQRL